MRIPFSLLGVLIASSSVSLSAWEGSGLIADSSQAEQQAEISSRNSEVVMPSAAPKPRWWANPYITADFIWWKATEGGLYYAYDGIAPQPDADARKGKYHKVDEQYDAGFKVGLGFNFKHDGWDFFSEYTRLHTGQRDSSVTVRSHDGLSGSWLVQVPGGGVSAGAALESASASWNIHFDMLDLELGKSYYVSKFLVLRPYVGIKLVWTEQHINVFYALLDSPPIHLLLEMEQEVMGTGIQAGLNAAWHMARNWSIFGDFCLSGLWNDYDSKRKDFTDISGGLLKSLNTRQHLNVVQPAFDFVLGLRFEAWFNRERSHFALQAGWEELLFPNYNQFVAIFNEEVGDLSFQGLTVQGRFDF